MSWVSSYSGVSTINLGGYNDGASSIFHLKELLKSVGWTVLSSSDGTTYQSSGDQISHIGSGAGGWTNANAWFRIEDPNSNREYVFQKNSTARQIKWLYSASAGFSGGSPDAVTIPTAIDQQGLAKISTGFQTMFNAGSYVHIVANSTAYNGVYAWWLASATGRDTTPEETLMICEPMDADYSTADSDPCVHLGSDDTPAYSVTSAIALAAATDSFRCWMDYGGVGEEWGGITTVYYRSTANYAPTTVTANPHNGTLQLFRIPFFRHTSTGSTAGFKGMSKYLAWCPLTSLQYPSVISSTSGNYLVWDDFCLPGFPSGVSALV